MINLKLPDLNTSSTIVHLYPITITKQSLAMGGTSPSAVSTYEDISNSTVEKVKFVFWFMFPVIIVLGIFGNVLNMITLFSGKLKGVAYVYLKWMAVADLSVNILAIPWALENFVYFNIDAPALESKAFVTFLCRVDLVLLNGFMKSSVLLVIALTVERYIAVCHPVRYKTLCSDRRAKQATAISYVIAFLISAPLIFQYTVVPKDFGLSQKLLNPPVNTLVDSNLVRNNTNWTTGLIKIVDQGATWSQLLKQNISFPSTLYEDSLGTHLDIAEVKALSPLFPNNIEDTANSINNKSLYTLMVQNLSGPIRATATFLDQDGNPLGTAVRDGKYFSKGLLLPNMKKVVRRKYTFDTHPFSRTSKVYKYGYVWFKEILLTFVPVCLIIFLNFRIAYDFNKIVKKRKQMFGGKRDSTIATTTTTHHNHNDNSHINEDTRMGDEYSTISAVKSTSHPCELEHDWQNDDHEDEGGELTRLTKRQPLSHKPSSRVANILRDLRIRSSIWKVFKPRTRTPPHTNHSKPGISKCETGHALEEETELGKTIKLENQTNSEPRDQPPKFVRQTTLQVEKEVPYTSMSSLVSVNPPLPSSLRKHSVASSGINTVVFGEKRKKTAFVEPSPKYLEEPPKPEETALSLPTDSSENMQRKKQLKWNIFNMLARPKLLAKSSGRDVKLRKNPNKSLYIWRNNNSMKSFNIGSLRVRGSEISMLDRDTTTGTADDVHKFNNTAFKNRNDSSNSWPKKTVRSLKDHKNSVQDQLTYNSIKNGSENAGNRLRLGSRDISKLSKQFRPRCSTEPSTTTMTTNINHDSKRYKRIKIRRKFQNERRLIILMVAVVLLFLICILPAAFISIVFRFEKFHRKNSLKVGMIVSDTLEICNYSLNFYLYCFCSSDIRQALKSSIGLKAFKRNWCWLKTRFATCFRSLYCLTCLCSRKPVQSGTDVEKIYKTSAKKCLLLKNETIILGNSAEAPRRMSYQNHESSEKMPLTQTAVKQIPYCEGYVEGDANSFPLLPKNLSKGSIVNMAQDYAVINNPQRDGGQNSVNNFGTFEEGDFQTKSSSCQRRIPSIVFNHDKDKEYRV